MEISETKNMILQSDEFVIAELKKLRSLFELKKEIRYGQKRQSEGDTESVAEHVYGMQCLVDYFLPLEDPEQNWKHDRIRSMVQYHDIDEVITGDEVGYRKTEAAHKEERSAAEKVICGLPSIMHESIRSSLDEYEARKTSEAKFVKALDAIEPVFHLYDEAGKVTLAKLKTTKTQHDSIKTPHVKDFPAIKRFFEVMTTQFEKEGFYHPEA